MSDGYSFDAVAANFTVKAVPADDVDIRRLLAAVDFFADPLGDRPVPPWAFDCDCPLDPHHRWNCSLTPIWAQTMRDLDCNPWTVFEPMALVVRPVWGAAEPGMLDLSGFQFLGYMTDEGIR